MKKKSIYSPVKEQFKVLLEYVRILEMKKNVDHRNEIIFLIEFINTVRRQCEVYLNYELMKLGKKDG
jgi:predicted DNA-binding protein YlxM (UPF0122 family)